jgi:hypothetical protein
MSRMTTIKRIAQECEGHWLVAMGKAYDAGVVAGSGQHHITPLEREVLAEALTLPVRLLSKIDECKTLIKAVNDLRSALLELELRDIEDSE